MKLLAKLCLICAILCIASSARAQTTIDTSGVGVTIHEFIQETIDSLGSHRWAITGGPYVEPPSPDRAGTNDWHANDPEYWPYGGGPRIVSVRRVGTKLEICYRQSLQAYLSGGQPPDKIWKDIYVAQNDSVVFDHRVDGVIEPAKTTAEKILWPDEHVGGTK